MRLPWMLSSVPCVGDISAKFAEIVPNFIHEQVRLLERSEMAAPGHLVPMNDVGIAGLHPLAHRRHDLLGKHGDAGRYFYGVRGPLLRPKAFPIEPRR